MSEKLDVIIGTAKQYFGGLSDLTVRDYLLLSLLEKHDRMKFNCQGVDFIFDVKYDQAPVTPFGSGQELTFEFRTIAKQLTADSRGYITTDQLNEKDYLMNGGDLAIVNYYERKLPDLGEAISDNISNELYIDGTGTQRIDGLNSFLGNDGATTAADLVARPSDTYLGASTAPGVDSSVWTSDLATPPNAVIASDWPDGKGSVAYDWNSPVLPNIGSNNWGTGSSLWEVNCARILRATRDWLVRKAGKSGVPTLHLLGSDLFRAYKNHQEAKFRDIMPHPEARDLGFPDVLQQDGVMIQGDFACPAGEFYTINVHQMKVLSLYDSLFSAKGPWFSMKDMAYLFSCGFFGNIIYLAKFFGKGAKYN